VSTLSAGDIIRDATDIGLDRQNGRTALIRTIISLGPEDKQWLEQRARMENTSTAGLIRRLVARYRQEVDTVEPSRDDVLERTSGIWRGVDGLEYQRGIREEW